ncbi:hypothetical protein E2C01_055155 [Portunus trituberculatus]|uniref:Uncharacterized protein n=1 Tax=Portunus trituberculatus TaxID=210409 RepID=A0A5B7GQF8_PORTR|nr:hypothetical protein [Portunus trituberculatus]
MRGARCSLLCEGPASGCQSDDFVRKGPRVKLTGWGCWRPVGVGGSVNNATTAWARKAFTLVNFETTRGNCEPDTSSQTSLWRRLQLHCGHPRRSYYLYTLCPPSWLSFYPQRIAGVGVAQTVFLK